MKCNLTLTTGADQHPRPPPRHPEGAGAHREGQQQEARQALLRSTPRKPGSILCLCDN